MTLLMFRHMRSFCPSITREEKSLLGPPIIDRTLNCARDTRIFFYLWSCRKVYFWCTDFKLQNCFTINWSGFCNYPLKFKFQTKNWFLKFHKHRVQSQRIRFSNLHKLKQSSTWKSQQRVETAKRKKNFNFPNYLFSLKLRAIQLKVFLCLQRQQSSSSFRFFSLFASFSLRNPTPTYVHRQFSRQQSLQCMLQTVVDKTLTFTAPMKLINYSHTSLSFNNTVFHWQRIKGKRRYKRMTTNFQLYSRCLCRPGRLYNKFIHTHTHTHTHTHPHAHTGRQRCPQLWQQTIGTASHYKTILKIWISKRI